MLDGLCRHPRRRDDGRSWPRLPSQGPIGCGPLRARRRAMERIPPELGAATDQRHELIVEGREELLYLLGEAAELEDAVFCTYLYAAFSLRAEPGERLVAEQVLASLPSNSATADTARSSTGNAGAGDHEAV